MQHFYKLINGIKISYYDNCASGHPILFIHGNSQSALTFRKQFCDSSLSTYRMIAIDLPGHGLSERDCSPKAYSLPYYADILHKFLHELDLYRPIIIGHSLGGHILMEALEQIQVSGIFIIGAPPVTNPIGADTFLPNDDMGLLYKESLTEDDVVSFLKLCFDKIEQVEESDIFDLTNTFGKARSQLAESLGKSLFKDELKVILNSNIPTAILSGKLEKLINNQYFSCLDYSKIWRNQLILPNCGHNVHLEAPLEFNKLLLTFLQETLFREEQNLRTSYVIC